MLSLPYYIMNFDHNLWGEIVTDGPRFCHWGGKHLSQQLVKMMRIKSTDRILDVCCGQGGTTDYMTGARLVIGIDISKEATVEAHKTSKNLNALFLTADARSLPFPDNGLDKIIAQDADAWMHNDKVSLMKEMNRVLRPGGVFFWQSYATGENPIQRTTKKLLKKLGYSSSEIPRVADIRNMFIESGFSIIKFQSLHKIYYEDNIKMLKKAKEIDAPKNLIKLLEWEKELFNKKLWTGILVIAKRAS